MKIRMALVSLTLTLVASMAVSAQSSSDFAHGNGQIEFQDKVSNFSFTAKRRKDGTVEGTLVYHQRSATTPENNISVHMKINCLTVVGNTATIQGVITKADPEFVLLDPNDPNSRFDLVGARAFMHVVDGGNGNSPADTASPLVITGGGDFCSATFPQEMYRTTNIVVRGGQ